MRDTTKRTPRELADYIANRINLRNLDSSRPVLQYMADRGRASLSQIASDLRVSRGTCNLHLQRLEHDQYIRRFESKRSGAGRPTVIWGWDEPANLTLSLVFDVPFLHASVADFGLNPILREVRDLSGIDSRKDLSRVIHSFALRAHEMALSRGAKLRQAMVYLPGLLDHQTGVVRKAANFPLLEGMEFGRVISEAAHVPCQSAPLGLAFYFGESESLPAEINAMVIYWDLGVGVMFGHGGSISPFGVNRKDGDPTLPELGHLRIEKNGKLCHCGQRGCLEAYAGGAALMDALRRKSPKRLADFIRLVQHGDADAVRLSQEAAEQLGRSLAWSALVMQTGRIRVCGPMAPVFEVVSDHFRRGLATLLTEQEIVRLDPAASPALEERFLRGAHRLARRLFTHPDEYGLLLRTPASLDGNGG
ncbi:MAG: ROK family transcriptional regulator [Verrucomicrobia bacterium]|nr:ROK family transcriptional regulator [Verrucomicrobiota bacterium]